MEHKEDLKLSIKRVIHLMNEMIETFEKCTRFTQSARLNRVRSIELQKRLREFRRISCLAGLK